MLICWLRFLFLCMLFVSLGASAAESDQKIYNFLVNKENIIEYKNFLSGRDPLSIKDYTSEYLWRQILELYVFQIAPVIGGCQCQVQYEPNDITSSYSRPVYDTKAGRVLSHPIAGYAQDIRFDDSIMLSDEVIDGDSFYVGLYTHESRNDVLDLTDIEKIKKLRVVVISHWNVDISVLENLGMNIVFADDWHPALNMIKAGRADFILQPFTKHPDLEFHIDAINYTLKPIKNVKIHFDRSRYYMVSRKYKGSTEFLGYLNKGLKILRDSGKLKQMQMAAGFSQEKVKDWAIIK